MYVFPNTKATESKIIKLVAAGGKSFIVRGSGDFFFALPLFLSDIFSF